jgi:hypothetical protein
MYCMKRYPVALLRERLSEALNEADRGTPVIIERRGVQYRLAREPERRRTTPRKPVIERIDPVVAGGEWSWEWTPDGLILAGPRRQ